MDEDHLDDIALFKHFCHRTTSLSSTERLVAIILMSHRNNISMMCCPGFMLLSKEASLSKSTICRAIKQLIIKKELVKLPIYSDKIYIKNQYYFLYDIEHAKQIFNNDESIFYCHHETEYERFEECLKKNLF